ncbi:hypothetical protein [Jonesia denitrificans]|uniref:Uncharacterized protein n=1 Tax=Jonesia denitrificans (strain ATCC 14870 / DSM 20603 / BCRC 15368 / CIP 55.134 / JCM 11481 / NBRC 15587 / NCTC 10816 / Prevot 55134) TaxID=471856 RepID=C7R1V9_JONDD|nr:hypothetical protein [Jonesia denitrificans]ACV08427.1 hypothetical protein Jden_0764 [Jonesia denitrificans DSM 20603]ASE07927.1 hypothetical protein CEP80_01345 [Jonesia denitrificans]QXB42535.1 hypothetical protein I6L70_08205 [Jonesia denitrificans]SQH20406.1 Uncharacterised protein [Jonesia denitrificans]
MWKLVETRIPHTIAEDVAAQAKREDPTDTVWLNINTGSIIVLASDGGWRNPESARYKVLYYAPNATVGFDITNIAAPGLTLELDPTQVGQGCYLKARAAGIEAVEKFIVLK